MLKQKKNFIVKFKYSLLLMTIFSKSYGQNLIKNGDFEYPITNYLCLKIIQQEQMSEWRFNSPVTIVNHLIVFQFSIVIINR